MKTLSLNILDIVQNSIRAKADEILIEVMESRLHNTYQINICDNGTGIPEEIFKKVTDPFLTTRTKRKMGLGLALLKYHAELAGGGLEIETEQGKGTRVKACFLHDQLDRQPLGDITGVFILLIVSNPDINFKYLHTTDNGEYRFSTRETKNILEVETLKGRELMEDIGSMISENLKEIGASGLTCKEIV
jgi:DNA mismatch repair ATPase MutL